jgi:imidazolonepropionase-like amidohydrolase
MHRHQSAEFEIRGRVLKPHEVIAGATSIAADLLMQSGKLGCIAPGAFADLIVVGGNPLKNLSLLGGQGDHMTHIMKDGVFVKRA